jgi:hypothetical protein
MPRAYSAGRFRCFGAASGIVAASARCVPNVEVGFQENPTERFPKLAIGTLRWEVDLPMVL